ncbi:MAG: peptidylprolyl isomerase [Gemmatimonadota bacterium]|nr:peptidylprolyl isomerase [Gemmatimonadota bacterium]
MRTSLALLVGLCAATPAAAQDSAFQPVDRIAAIVGDTPIPLSRVDEELNLYLGELQRAGRPLPQDSAEMRTLRRELIDRLIDDELLVQQARRDTMVKVTDAQVQSATDAAVRQTRGQFQSDFEFRRQLQLAGLGTPEEYRRYVSEQVRRDLVKQAFIQQKRERGDIRQLPPTDDEMRTYFEASKAQWPKRPATVSFRAIVIRPEATPAAKAEARRRADSVLVALRAGADFATAARRFSDDPGSRDDGGDLGWFRRGRMVREFEAAAFRLRPGQISNVVESPFGFHLIQVERVEPAEVKARHILFAPKLSDANLAAAQARADSVVRALQAGLPLDSLLRGYHDPLEQSLFEDVVPADLPEPLQQAVQGALPGDVLGPVQINEADRARFLALRFDGARPEGEYTFEELRDRIRARLAEDSGVRRYLQELRSATYIDIRL